MNRVARAQVQSKATTINRILRHAMIQSILATVRRIWSKYAVCHGRQLRRIYLIFSRMCTFRMVAMAFISSRTIRIILAWPTFNCQRARTMSERKIFITNCWAIDMLKVSKMNWSKFAYATNEIVSLKWDKHSRVIDYSHKILGIMKINKFRLVLFVNWFVVVVFHYFKSVSRFQRRLM